MSYLPETPRHRSIQLSEWKARRLTELLDGVIGRCGGQSNSDQLEIIHDKLQEAVWSAKWLREDVSLDITFDQGVTLSQALAVAPAGRGTQSDDELLIAEFVHPWQDLPVTPVIGPTARSRSACQSVVG